MADLIHVGAVDVAKRKMLQQVLECMDVEFFAKQVTALCRDTGEVFNRGG